mgnify:CR=1 FL=1
MLKKLLEAEKKRVILLPEDQLYDNDEDEEDEPKIPEKKELPKTLKGKMKALSNQIDE